MAYGIEIDFPYYKIQRPAHADMSKSWQQTSLIMYGSLRKFNMVFCSRTVCNVLSVRLRGSDLMQMPVEDLFCTDVVGPRRIFAVQFERHVINYIFIKIVCFISDNANGLNFSPAWHIVLLQTRMPRTISRMRSESRRKTRLIAHDSDYKASNT